MPPTAASPPYHSPRHCHCCPTRRRARGVARRPLAHSPAILKAQRVASTAQHRSQRGGLRPRPVQGTGADLNSRACAAQVAAAQSKKGGGWWQAGWLACASESPCKVRAACVWAAVRACGPRGTANRTYETSMLRTTSNAEATALSTESMWRRKKPVTTPTEDLSGQGEGGNVTDERRDSRHIVCGACTPALI